MTPTRTPLVVVYGLGSASPVDILHGAGDDIEVLLVVDEDDAHTAQVRPLLDFFPNRLSRDECEQRQPAGIVTFSERMLSLTAEIAAQLGLPYHSADTIRAVTDKSVQRGLLSHSSRLHARHVLLGPDSTAADLAEFPFPAVAKPLRGEGGKNVRLLRDIDDLPADMRQLLVDSPLIEQFFPARPHPANSAYGSYVSAEAFVIDGVVSHWAITDKLRPAYPFFETGSISPHRLPDADAAEVRDAATEALRLLGVAHGCVHVEIKLTPTGPKLIEVNGRLGGSVAKLMRATRGWDVVRATMELALGRVPSLPSPSSSLSSPLSPALSSLSSAAPLSGGCAVVVHVPTTSDAGPLTPRVRERVRSVAGVTAVDTAFHHRLLLGTGNGGATQRLVDLTLRAPNFGELWASLVAALAALRDGGAHVTDAFVAYAQLLLDTENDPGTVAGTEQVSGA